jgi:hypothetical protein
VGGDIFLLVVCVVKVAHTISKRSPSTIANNGKNGKKRNVVL